MSKLKLIPIHIFMDKYVPIGFNQFNNPKNNGGQSMNLIQHNLEVAKPRFLYFIRNMNYELRQWIQYRGVEVEGSSIYFKFKSSQNSLSFEVYAGVNIGDIEWLLDAHSNEIYDFFKQLKNNQ